MRRDRNLPADLLVLLGTTRDEEIAERFGLSCTTVRRTRRDLGLRQPPKAGLSNRERVLAVRERLGTVTDDVVGRAIRVPQQTVSEVRRELSIRSSRQRARMGAP